MNDQPDPRAGDFDLSATYDQVIEPQLSALADECQKRGIPFAFYVVPKIHEGVNDAREFAAGEGDFIRSVTYLARNWQHVITMIQSVSNFAQHAMGTMKAIAMTEMRYNQDLENEDEQQKH